MAMMTCKECGGRRSTKAVACPHCGATTKPMRVLPATSFVTKVITALVILVGLFVVVAIAMPGR
jgi:uncharacterized OB-fold protein